MKWYQDSWVRLFAGLVVLLVILDLCGGCISRNVITPYGSIKVNSFAWKSELPEGTYSVTTVSSNGVTTNMTLSIKGYTGSGDSEVINATAGAIGTIMGAAVKAAAAAK